MESLRKHGRLMAVVMQPAELEELVAALRQAPAAVVA
jgi:hypothetical protein